MVGAAIATDHGAHSMRTVSMTIPRDVIPQVIGVEPVVVVVKSAAVIPAILTNKCLVRIAYTCIDIGDNQSCAINTHCPNVVCVNVCQVGFNRIQTVVLNRSTFIGFVEHVRLTSFDPLNPVQFYDVVQNSIGRAGHQNGVVDPEALVLNLTA